MKKIISTLIIATTLYSCGTKIPKSMSKEEFNTLTDGLYAKMQTTKGDLTIQLYQEESPIAVASFVGLAEGDIENTAKPLGEPFYDGIVFHRIIKDFMIQGGDPDGSGMGGPGYSFQDEFFSELKHDKKGVLSMANSGPNTNGSQFFLTEVPTPWLDGKHTIFGQVINGLDVVDSLANAKTNAQDKPLTELKIEKLDIIRKGEKYKDYKGNEAFVKAKANHKARQEEVRKKLQVQQEQAAQRIKELTAKAQTTESGLQYVLIEEGKGEKPVNGDKINVHYTLRLANGDKIDSSYDRNQPLPIEVGKTGLITGWLESLTMFNRGSKVFLIVPPQLGYGAAGAGGGLIPANATLYFDMEFLN